MGKLIIMKGKLYKLICYNRLKNLVEGSVSPITDTGSTVRTCLFSDLKFEKYKTRVAGETVYKFRVNTVLPSFTQAFKNNMISEYVNIDSGLFLTRAYYNSVIKNAKNEGLKSI